VQSLSVETGRKRGVNQSKTQTGCDSREATRRYASSVPAVTLHEHAHLKNATIRYTPLVPTPVNLHEFVNIQLRSESMTARNVVFSDSKITYLCEPDSSVYR